MTKEITQEERLDLTDIKEEKEVFAKCIEDKIKTLLKDTKGSVIIDTKGLYAENERLKIKNNKMKRLLKDLDYWLGQELNLNYFKGEIMSFVLTKDYIMEEQKKKIEEVLKKVEE